MPSHPLAMSPEPKVTKATGVTKVTGEIQISKSQIQTNIL